MPNTKTTAPVQSSRHRIWSMKFCVGAQLSRRISLPGAARFSFAVSGNVAPTYSSLPSRVTEIEPVLVNGLLFDSSKSARRAAPDSGCCR